VKIYYDVANSTQRGYDVPREIRWLGKQQQICEFHMKENGALLGHGKVDFKRCARRSTTSATAAGCRSKAGSRPAEKSSKATSQTAHIYGRFSQSGDACVRLN